MILSLDGNVSVNLESVYTTFKQVHNRIQNPDIEKKVVQEICSNYGVVVKN